MQRTKTSIETLLKQSSHERAQEIFALDEKEVNEYILYLEKELHLHKRTLVLQPAEVIDKKQVRGDDYQGKYFGSTDFAVYKGDVSVDKNYINLVDLLNECKAQKNNLDFHLRNTFKLLLLQKGHNGEEYPALQVRDDLLQEHGKIVDAFKKSVEEIRSLKEEIAEKNKLIEKLKTNLKEFDRDKFYLNRANSFTISRLNSNNSILKKQQEALVAMLEGKHGSQESITIQELKDIINKWKDKNFSIFSHAPELLKRLKGFLGKEYIYKSEILSCIDKRQHHLFLSPPFLSDRYDLTQRERIICELADAFNRQALPELKKGLDV